MKRWEADGDAAAAVGALRGAIETWPRRKRLFAYAIGTILQSEGRSREAAAWYWEGIPQPDGSLNVDGSLWHIVRIFDALEDAERTEEMASLLLTVDVSRRELYIRAASGLVKHPLWVRKFARKLLADDPKDVRAQKALKRSEDEIARRAASPERFPTTRDVPFESRGK